jgi:hypothetical protein
MLNLIALSLFKMDLEMENPGRILITVGILLVMAGLLLLLTNNKLSWLFHLPGDIRIEKENFHIYLPITTMFLLSVLLSIIVFIIRKLIEH